MTDEVLTGYLSQRPFVTRSWLAEAVEALLDEERCRHVLLTADAGMGKSSFLAWLSTRHPVAPWYFIRLDSVSPHASGDSLHLLMSIGRQLADLVPQSRAPIRIEIRQRFGRIRRGGRAVGLRTKRLITHPFRDDSVSVHQRARHNDGEQVGIEADEVVDSEWLLTPEQLQRLALFEPAGRLAERDPAARIVVLVDGLDELRVQGRGRGRSILDWLTECPQLPSNVRVVVTCRPDPELLLAYRIRQRPWLRELSVDAAHEQVAGDAREYGRQLTGDRELRRALAGYGVSLENVVRAVTRRARGNFLYLVAWTRSVRHAVATARTADVLALVNQHELPADLEALHALSVELLRAAAGPLWDGTHRRVLAVLAVARGPLRPRQLAVLARTRLVDEALSDMPQLTTTTYGRVGIFHRSLAEYLTAARTRAAAPDHWIDPAMTHQESAAALIAEFGGDWSACTDEYALTNVVGHLVEALRTGTENRPWCVRTLAELLADPGFTRRQAEVVPSVRVLVDFGEAYLAMRPDPEADALPRLLALRILGAGGTEPTDADTVHAGLGYRRDFDEFHGRLLEYLGDLDFVAEHAPAGDTAGAQPVSVWADFAEVLAGRHRRHREFDTATELLERVAGVRGDQSRRLYEAGYLHFLHGRVDEALEHLTESVQAAEDANRPVGWWISRLVHDQIALFADRIDHDEYAATLADGLAFFTAEAQTGAAHGPRWVMNVHDRLLTLACLRGDGAAAHRHRETLSEDEWTLRERPDLPRLWEARAAIARNDHPRAAELYADLLGPDALHAPPPNDEGIAWRLHDYGVALAGIGRTHDAVLAWQQVLRCADSTAAWPWKPRATALLHAHLPE